MNEGRGLKRLPWTLATHVGGRDPPQLVVDERRNVLGLGRGFFGHRFGVPGSGFQVREFRFTLGETNAGTRT